METSKNHSKLREAIKNIETHRLSEAAEGPMLRTCVFCGKSPAPRRITRITAEQRAENQAWADSLKVEYHTGHCPHLELPTYACQECLINHPEAIPLSCVESIESIEWATNNMKEGVGELIERLRELQSLCSNNYTYKGNTAKQWHEIAMKAKNINMNEWYDYKKLEKENKKLKEECKKLQDRLSDTGGVVYDYLKIGLKDKVLPKIKDTSSKFERVAAKTVAKAIGAELYKEVEQNLISHKRNLANKAKEAVKKIEEIEAKIKK